MSDSRKEAREFNVETNFQKLARRPGGIARDQALKNAAANIDAFKPGFEGWLDQELANLLELVSRTSSKPNTSWIESAERQSQRLVDVAETMDYPLMSFVANNLCLILEALRCGAEYRAEVIGCHIDAILLSRQPQYRHLRSEDLPELSVGLTRFLEAPRLQPGLDDKV